MCLLLRPLSILLPSLLFLLFSVTHQTQLISNSTVSRSINITDIQDQGPLGAIKLGRKCNYFIGRWVFDPKYPLYSASKCPFISQEFSCLNRPDSLYLKYRWQPFSCNLPRFNGLYFLERLRGKKIMFVGDSLSLNMFQSLACLIHSWVPNSKYTVIQNDGLTSITFQDFGVEIFLFRTQFLVDVVHEKVGRVLKLDSIRQGKAWRGMDMLIFNTWHWWTHTQGNQPWDYIREGKRLYKDMNRLMAYYKGLTTWARWVNLNVDQAKTKVFFQGVSPVHYDGREWSEAGRSCSSQAKPYFGFTYPAGKPLGWVVVNKVLSRIKKPVYLLDVTMLSEYRKDAHPGSFSGLHHGLDCSHWCLPGLPDTWNTVLYAALFG